MRITQWPTSGRSDRTGVRYPLVSAAIALLAVLALALAGCAGSGGPEQESGDAATASGDVPTDISGTVRILMENGYGHLVFGTADYAHDPTHMNDIQPVLADGPYWKKGDVFVSLRNVSSIVLYRPSEDHIVWLKQWPWVNQHDVDILDDHRISVFDNHKYNFRNNRPEVHGHNDVKIYDFATDTVSSPWAQAMTDQDVRTIDMGRQEIVSDDAVILEETDYGRLMELQRDGSTGWEYVNRAGDGKIYLLNWTRTLDRAEGDAFLAEVRAAGCTAHLEAKL